MSNFCQFILQTSYLLLLETQVSAQLIQSQLIQSGDSISNSISQSERHANDVSQLKDVRPLDWAVRNLQSLVKRYGVMAVGDNRWLTRQEFAANLNAVMSRFDRAALPMTNRLFQQDKAMLQRLETEFAMQLASIRANVSQLESRGADLKSQQFSTTTKLRGQAIVAINAGGFNGGRIMAPRGSVVTRDSRSERLRQRPNPTSLYRVSLDLDTSFNGKDLLKTRLISGSDGIADNAGGRLEPNLGSTLDFSIPGRNQVGLGQLYYTFSPQPDLSVTIGSVMAAPDFVDRNRHLTDKIFIAGDYSIADIMNYAWVSSGLNFIRTAHAERVANLTTLDRWLTTVGDRPAVIKGLEVLKSL